MKNKFELSKATKAGLLFAAVFLSTMFFVFKDDILPKENNKTFEQKADSAAINWIFENSYADSIQVFGKNSYKTYSKEDRQRVAIIDSLILSQDIFCENITINVDSLKKEKNSMSRDFYVREITFYADYKKDQYTVQVICDKNFNVVEHVSERKEDHHFSSLLFFNRYFAEGIKTDDWYRQIIRRGNIKTKCK